MLPDHFEIDVNKTAERLGLDGTGLNQALKEIALQPGGLENKQVEHLFLDNPVWTSPLVAVRNGFFFSGVPQAFFSHIYRIVGVICERHGLASRLSDRRSEYLESEAHRLVSKAIRSGKTRSSVQWRQGGREYETDVLAHTDTCLLAMEAKAGALTPSALRGAPDRAKRHVQDLIFEPSIQSLRLKELIEAARAGDTKSADELRRCKIDFGKASRVIRFSVTLEDLSVLASSEEDLKRVSWVPQDHPLSPAATLADLEVVLDILEDEAIILHYLDRRLAMQKRHGIVADELDWLGLYLSTLFNFQINEDEPVNFMLTGMSAPIDAYYNALDSGVSLKKPRHAGARLWRENLGKIQRQQFEGWTEAAFALLNAASPEEQVQFESSFGKIRRRVPAIWKQDGHQCAGVVTPPGDGVTAIAFFAYPPQLASSAKDRSGDLAKQSFSNSRVSACLVLGFNTSNDGPYSALGMFKR
jgi:hypothetical protein